MDYQELRERYPEFRYRKFSTELNDTTLTLSFEFTNGAIKFNPRVEILNIHPEAFQKIDKQVIDNFVFHLGLIEMLSYWKATASPKIIIEAGLLNDAQTAWWHNLLIQGMGQFYFENDIDFAGADFVEIESLGARSFAQKVDIQAENLLVPLGGGKDSAVTLTLLKDYKGRVGSFALNPTKAVEDMIRTSGVANTVFVKRQIDPKLLQLNEQGYLNGHTPFSAYLAFLSTFCAVLSDYKYVAFSNERSSDEANTQFLGQKINHQYSKTSEFEAKYRDYNKAYLSNVEYFSFLRPLYEIQISKLFSSLDQYFPIIRSCNIGQKTNTWCCSCPKCLSTFILLYPFLGHEQITQVFPKNMYDNESLNELLNSLIDDNKIKPFECVGTRRELRIALFLSWKKDQGGNLPALLSYAYHKLGDREKELSSDAEKIMDEWNEGNFLPLEFEKILKEQYA